jgi:hypothetical protein
MQCTDLLISSTSTNSCSIFDDRKARSHYRRIHVAWPIVIIFLFLFNDSLVLFLSIQIVMSCVVVFLYHAYFGFTINSNVSLNVLKRILGKIYLTCFILIYQPIYSYIINVREYKGAIKNGQSRKTDKTGYTRRRKTKQ